MVFKRYSKDYEEGRCPMGYEFVSGYTDSHSVWHDSYCRKIKKVRISDEQKVINREQKEEQESLDRAKKIFWEDQ